MTDFVQLQLRMKRDPPGYREDFLQQCRHFMSNLQIFKLQPLAKAGRSAAETAAIFDHNNKTKDAAAQKNAAAATGQGPVQSRRVQEFCALIAFISFTAHLYYDEVKKLHIPQELYALLFQHCEALDPFLRKTLVQALILLQNKNLIPRLELLPALFRCFRCADKELRQSVFLHIVADIQKLSKTNPSVSMTTALQKVVFGMLKEDHPGVALKALYVLIELWKRNVWVTEKVVNAISSMCFSTDDKLVSAALYYFLGQYDTSDEEEEDLKSKTLAKMKEIQVVKVSLKHIKRRMKKTRELERNRKAVKRAEKEMYGEDEDDSDEEREKRMKSANVNPLSMIYDAQHFAERLFFKLKTSRETFNTRMLMMNVLSKLIGMHKLLLFNFFPFIQRYLQPHQRHVTSLLSFVARATHSLVPPEVLHPLVKTIANHFVTDRSPPEVMAIGINAIREICSRAPLVMTEELLHDLSDYSRHKNKGIMSATRSLMQVFRELNPALLRRKDRGRDAQMALSVMNGPGADAERLRHAAEQKLQYGMEYVHKDVDGVDLLMEAGAIPQDEASAEWDSDIGEFDPDELLDADDEDDESPPKKSGRRIQLTKSEIKKLRSKRGKVLRALRKKIYEAHGISLGDQEDEDGNDLIDAALADDEANGGQDGDEDADDEDEAGDEDEMDMDALAAMMGGEGDEGDLNGWEVDDEDMEMGEGDEDMEMQFDEDMEEDAEEDAEQEEEDEVQEPVSKRIKSSDDISDKIVQLADVKPIVPKAAIRILTPADFKKIELLKQKRMEEGLRGARLRQKDMLNDDILAQQDRMLAFRMGSYTELDENDLESSHIRKRKLDKEARLAKMKADKGAIIEAREFVKFGHKVKKDNLGLTNEEKLKTKNFVMVKHSRRVRHKAMRGFTEKQRSTSQHIKNLQKMSKNVKKGVAKRGRAKAGK